MRAYMSQFERECTSLPLAEQKGVRSDTASLFQYDEITSRQADRTTTTSSSLCQRLSAHVAQIIVEVIDVFCFAHEPYFNLQDPDRRSSPGALGRSEPQMARHTHVSACADTTQQGPVRPLRFNCNCLIWLLQLRYEMQQYSTENVRRQTRKGHR